MKSRFWLAALSLITISSHGSILSTVGQGDILVAGAGVGYRPDFFGDTTLVIHGWDERQNFTLTSNLAVDITTTGNYLTTASLTPGFIPAGTVINSHAFYYDPAGGGSAVAGFLFDGPVIGVILDDQATPDTLFASDYLIPFSVPATNIPPIHFDARGLEMGINIDHLTVNPGSVNLFLSAGSPGDQLRVITLATVPEPAAGLTLLAALFLFRKRLSQSAEL